MTKYAVEVTESALAAIAAQARYIALERQEPGNAQHWLEQIWDAADSLADWPFRAAKADEDSYVSYEVRQLIVGRHLLLFTVDDHCRTVKIIGVRHRRPRPDGDVSQHSNAPEEDDS